MTTTYIIIPLSPEDQDSDVRVISNAEEITKNYEDSPQPDEILANEELGLQTVEETYVEPVPTSKKNYDIC